MIVTRRGVVEGGRIRLEDDAPLPEHAEVLVVFVAPAHGGRSMTGAELAASEFVGMWADREAITDSVEYARQLREQAETRDYGDSA